MKMKLFLLLAASAATSLYAQVTPYTMSNSGLVHGMVNAIAIDAGGIKWFGTAQGVSKFDGTNWTTYDTSNSGINDNYVNAVAVDAGGIRWFGTNKGLAKFDGANWANYNSSNSGLLPSSYAYPEMVASIAVSADGKKWVANERGLFMYDNAAWHVIDTTGGVGVVVAGSDGSIYYSIKDSGSFNPLPGITKISGGVKTHYGREDVGLPTISGIAVDQQGKLWAAGSNAGTGGVAVFDGTSWTHPPCGDFPQTVAVDPQGIVWVGISDGSNEFALYSWDGSVWSAHLKDHPEIRVIVSDQQGRKWAAFGLGYTSNSGVLSFDILTSVSEPHGQLSTAVYPNPASSRVFFRNVEAPIGRVRIYGLDGNLLIDTPFGNEGIDVNALPKGPYMAELETGNGTARLRWCKTD